MKALILTFFISFSAGASDSDFGKSLMLKSDVQGKLQFGVTYTLGYDSVGLNFLLMYTTVLTNSELSSLPSKIRWNIFLSNKNDYLYEWSDAHVIQRSALITNHFKLNNRDVESLKLLLINQAYSRLVFSHDASNTPIYNLDIGELCLRSPNYFKNLSNNKKCSELTEADVN